jgi:hypothetical protein
VIDFSSSFCSDINRKRSLFAKETRLANPSSNMRIIASSISLLSTAFLFGQAALSNAENAEETLIRDAIEQDAPIHHHGPVNAVVSLAFHIINDLSYHIIPQHSARILC